MIDQCEPTLEELLNEPIIRQVMKSDGVRPDDIRRLMEKAHPSGNGTSSGFIGHAAFQQHSCSAAQVRAAL